MAGLFGSRVYQTPRGTRELICPNCVSLTEHQVVEEAELPTLFEIIPLPLRSARRVAYMCSECGELHRVPWDEYVKQHSGAPYRTAARSRPGPRVRKEMARQVLESAPVAPSRQAIQVRAIIVITLVVIALLAVLILLPALTALFR